MDRWVRAVKNDDLELALEAVIKATLNHGIGHWLTALVCDIWNIPNDMQLIVELQRVGIYSPESLAIMKLPSSSRLAKLGPIIVIQNLDSEKVTPKELNAVWCTTAGEPGNYVEVLSQGGIIGFDSCRDVGKYKCRPSSCNHVQSRITQRQYKLVSKKSMYSGENTS